MANQPLQEMQMRLYYGYEQGKFVLLVTDDTVGTPEVFARVSIRRSDVARIANHMRFGKEGDVRVIVDHHQLVMPQRQIDIHYNPHEYAHCDGRRLSAQAEIIGCELCGAKRKCYYYCANHHQMICLRG